LEPFFAGREVLSPADIANMAKVPPQDRIWVLLFLIKAIDGADRLLRHFACDCAVRALRREREAGREPDPRILKAVEVSRRLADGKATEEERSIARVAAAEAANKATGCSAIEATTCSAAWATTKAIAWRAAWESAWYTQWPFRFKIEVEINAELDINARLFTSTEQDWQIRRLLEYIEGRWEGEVIFE